MNLVEGLCSQVTYIAWDSAGVGGLPTHQHRRKREGGGWRRRGPMCFIPVFAMVKLSPLPPGCPLLSVTLPRRQLFPLLSDDVGQKSGAPATQKARFGQNRVRGGATVKRKRSHRTPVYWRRRRGCRKRMRGEELGDCTACEIGLCVYVSGSRFGLPVRACLSGAVSEHCRCLV